MQILTSKVDPRAERVNIASADVINISIISSSRAFEPDNDLHILISQCEFKTKLMLPPVPAQQTRVVDPLLVQWRTIVCDAGGPSIKPAVDQHLVFAGI